MTDHPLWCEKYRPRKIADCVLPASIKAKLQAQVDAGLLQNAIYAGPSGVGKTSVALAACDELKADCYKINGSKDTNMEMIRTSVDQFATTVSLVNPGARKYVVIDEADNLPFNVQQALRGFIEEVSGNCGFILTGNFKGRIQSPIHSRCPPIDFKPLTAEKPALALEFFGHVQEMLTAEGVEFEKEPLAKVIQMHFPDLRRVIGELQSYARVNGKIDAGILAATRDPRIASLVDHMKAKNYTAARKWVAENSDLDSASLFRAFFDQASNLVTSDSVPALVIVLGTYQYRAAFVADPEINAAAALAEIMATVTWK